MARKAVSQCPRYRGFALRISRWKARKRYAKNSPHGVISIQNELNGFFGAINKHGGDKGGGLDRSFWINTYDGGQYAVNRIGRGGIAGYIVNNLSVGILGGIQPDVIKRIMSGYSDDGIIQRFIRLYWPMEPMVMTAPHQMFRLNLMNLSNA